jgi:putative tryptophan/tyrosine transport system substrate-binding protein
VDRREFICLATLALFSAPFVAEAQPADKVARVGLLLPSRPADWDRAIHAFRQRMRELDWIEGQNLILDFRYAKNNYERLPTLAAELVALKPDAIFAGAAAATRAAARATTTIPVVFETLGDAVSQGLVPSLAHPGGNVTGVSGFSPELTAKRLQLIREILPRAARIAILANPENPNTASVVRATEMAARQQQIELDVIDIRDPTQLEGAFTKLTLQRADAFLLVADPMLYSQSQRIVEMAARHRLPTAYETRAFPDRGGLLSYGPAVDERFQRMAVYVDRILRGTKPADLPVEQPTKFELVINAKTAKALGLTIPQSLLLRADQVIE